MLPFNASRQGETMTVSPYTKPLNRDHVALPPCRVVVEAGRFAFPSYGEPFGFFARFLPRNGWMLKRASCSLSAP